MPQNAGDTGIHIFVAFFTSTPAFQFAVDIFHSISGHFNALFLTVRSYLSNHASLQLVTHFHQLTTSIMVTLQAFLQLKYQWIHDQNQSPFSTHPIAMRVAVATSALHYLAYAAALRFPLHRLAHHLVVSSGDAAVAALSSVFFPDSAAPFVYAVFGLLSTAELLLWMGRKLIEEDDADVWIGRWRIRRFFNFNNIYGDLRNSSAQRMRRLPV